MKRAIALVVGIVGLVLGGLVIYHFAGNRAQAQVEAAAPTLDPEFQGMILKYTATMFIWCGDTVYAGDPPGSSSSWFKDLYGHYREYKDKPTLYSWTVAELRDVDKMNGIEKVFSAEISQGVHRDSNDEGHWGDWKEEGDLVGGTVFVKRNGQWYVTKAMIGADGKFHPDRDSEQSVDKFWAQLRELAPLPTCEQIAAIK